MNRQELYRKIKALHLEDEIKKTFKDNYTRISNDKLEGFIKTKELDSSPSKKVIKCSSKIQPKKPESLGVKIGVIKLIGTLQAKKLITATEAEEIIKSL